MANRLTFEALSNANYFRCETSYHDVADWSETDWATAIAGEVGEACNLIKKRRRDDGAYPSAEDVGKELADAVIYIDLLCARMGLELGEIVANKFNEVSERVKSPVKV
jgi:NTP pyrophosphatase (non-canonical NTP hydrolase)